MKKVIISLSIVLVIIIGITSMIAVAFASWDIKDAVADIETGSIGTDIKLNVTVDSSVKDTKQLIPDIAEIYDSSKQANEIVIAKFKVNLSSSDKTLTESQLAAKVKFDTSNPKVTYQDGGAIEFKPEESSDTYTWERYFDIGIYKGASSMAGLVDGVGEYTIKLSFTSFQGVTDSKEKEFIQTFAGKSFKVGFKLIISAK